MGKDVSSKRDEHRNESSYTLKELGILNTKDTYGEDRLTISLPPNPIFGTGEVQAVFDTSARQWKIEVTAHTRYSQKINKSTDQKLKLAKSVPSNTRPAKWTDVLPHTDHVQRFLTEIDWASTSLGPLETWPATLCAYLSIVFADNEAAVIYWGNDLIALYNEGFINIASSRLTKSQNLLGTPFVEIWPELWADFEPMLKAVAARGVGFETIDVNLFPTLNGKVEETFWQGSFLPITDETGQVRGFYNRAREVTKSVISQRLFKVQSTIASKPNLTGDFIYKHLVKSLALSSRDFPLTFVYSAKEDVLAGTCTLQLECAEGLPTKGHALVPQTLELFEGSIGFLPYYRKAKSKDKVLILREDNGTLPHHLTDGFEWGGFRERSHSLAILPLSTSDRLTGMLVLGLNPRRPVDEEMESFLNTLHRSISATVSSAIDREEARLRASRLAKQLEESEKSIRELAEYGPVGMARYTAGGRLMWANDQYFEITGQSRDISDQYEMSFLEFIHPEDKSACEDLWKTMSRDKKSTSNPFRTRRLWTPPALPDDTEPPEEHHVWVLGSAYPIFDGEEVKAFAVSVMEISKFKWAEEIQEKTAKAAKEAKRLQENFIDIVSHEMRNPLSALTQLSDAISESSEEFDKSRRTEQDARDLIKSNADNAKTILLCADHMKRIIDDVLTLSKLDSMLLSITPVIVQPYKIIESVLRMFDAEFAANEIVVESGKNESYEQLEVDWVSLDPSRLTQIFINLVTNAVKFTRLEEQRRIIIRVGASATRPPTIAGVKWFPTNKKYRDLTQGAEWGGGQPIYILFEVQDTGRGLEQEEMTKLFGRFQQATEKTHLKYGGSGLGLFISRELTETQGGEIGVRSVPGKGTTFAFYVKATRAEEPKDPANLFQPATNRRSTRGQLREAEAQQKTDHVEPNQADRSISVLLCEDNIVNSRILKKQLEKSRCEVMVASHGMEALDYLAKSRAWVGMEQEKGAIDFDVVLMDVEMPIMDGLTCTRRIRQLQEERKLTKHINIIAITANARQEQINEVLRTGPDAVLPKPFRVKECISKIEELLYKKPGSAIKDAVKK